MIEGFRSDASAKLCVAAVDLVIYYCLLQACLQYKS